MFLKTGFGVFIKDGKKLRKFELTPGEHPDPVGYTVVEVANKFELESIVLDKSQEDMAQEHTAQRKAAFRESGKAKLKSFGLTDDEIEAMIG